MSQHKPLPLIEIEKRFTHHPPSQTQVEKYQRIRDQAKSLALLINEDVPVSRELHLSLGALEEAVFYANAGIARRSPGADPDEPG